jgi:hypothetical protein
MVRPPLPYWQSYRHASEPSRRRLPPRFLHHFVCHPAEEKGISLSDVLGRGYCTMIADPSNLTLMEYRRGRIA